jgi:hypothetical protein
MSSFRQTEIKRFLEENQEAIAGLVVQAYDAAGGHYALMSPDDRRRQAATDVQEFIADLLRGGIDRDAVHQTVANTAGEAPDIVRLSTALDHLFATFVQERLADHPDLAEELIRVSRNLNASFRANLTAAQLDTLLRRFGPKK